MDENSLLNSAFDDTEEEDFEIIQEVKNIFKEEGLNDY